MKYRSLKEKEMDVKLKLPGFPVSKKNSKIRTKQGKYIPSKRYKLWEDMAIDEVSDQYQGKPISRIEAVYVEVRLPNYSRRRDLDNMLTSVLDMLQRAEVVTDDDAKVMPFLAVQGILDVELPAGQTTIHLKGCQDSLTICEKINLYWYNIRRAICSQLSD